MKNTDLERVKATRRVMKTVARESAFEPLPIVLEDGSSPVVVALPDDEIESVYRRIRKFGSAANVFVAYPENTRLIGMRLGEEGAPAAEQLGHGHMSMAMYVDFLLLNPNKSSTITISIGESVATSGTKELQYSF